MNLFLKKTILALLFILIYDLLFFSPLFFPSQKLIITPEFGGGDTTVIQLPYKYILCNKIKKLSLPFWSKDLSLGYPLLAEGEIGAFNPINILTCFFYDYKTAFNLQIVFHTIVAQMGFLILGSEIGLSIFASLFLAILFPFTPIILMNYMQITLVYSFFYMSYILTGIIKIFKSPSFKSFLFLTLSVFFQSLVCHYQISFISFVFSFVFLITLIIKQNNLLKLKNITFFFSAYFFAVSLACFQFLPAFELFKNSDRSLKPYGAYSSIFDQNLNIKNFFTIFNPYLFGKPQNASFPFNEMAHPWEATFFIYYISIPFLFLVFFRYTKIKNKFLIPLIVSFFLILLIALGQNSPIYLIHFLPLFSSLRFPTRFIMINILILSILAAIGFDYIISRIKRKLQIFLFSVTIFIIFVESFHFNYTFHVIKNNDKLFTQSKAYNNIPSIRNSRLFNFYDTIILDKTYITKGYSGSDQFYYYSILNDSISPNINLIYNLPSFSIRAAGPQLKRWFLLYSYAHDNIDLDTETKVASFSATAKNVLSFSAVDYVISLFKLENNDYLTKIKTINNKEFNYVFYLYRIKNTLSRIEFYPKTKFIRTFKEFKNELKSFSTLNNHALIEDAKAALNSTFSNIKLYRYKFLSDEDERLVLKTSTPTKSFLVVSDNYYPGWKAFIDGSEVNIFKANFAYRGIILPKGEHTVEFKYVPESFYLGAKVSLLTLLILIGAGVTIYLKKRPRVV